MNKYDRENLQFLLNANKETLMDWYDNVPVDDHEYASTLLDEYKKELAIKESIYTIEDLDLTKSVDDANNYLKKFNLGKR